MPILFCGGHAAGQVVNVPRPEPSVPFPLAIVSGADLDGDGRVNMAIGAGNGGPTSRVYLYSGDTLGVFRTLVPPDPGSTGFAGSVAVVPSNLSGGGPLLALGAHCAGPADPPCPGRVYLMDPATGALVRTLAPPQDLFALNFGSTVGALTDVNGDGHGDVVVATSYGIVYVYSGGTGGLIAELAAEPGEAPFINVGGLPDLDGDGAGEFFISAPNTVLEGENRHGRLFIYSGATRSVLFHLDTPPGWTCSSGGCARSVRPCPDLNGDGVPDLLMPTLGWEGPGVPYLAGRLHVFSGADGSLLYSIGSPNEEEQGQFGTAAAGLPDLDGDGRGDLLVGAYREDPYGRVGDSGAAYVFSGADGRLLRVLLSPNPIGVPNSPGWFGARVSGLASETALRRAMLIVGAIGEGRAYAFMACRADADANGVLDSRDITRFVTGWIQTRGLGPEELGPPGVFHGDYNQDGLITAADLSDFLSAWLGTLATGCR